MSEKMPEKLLWVHGRFVDAATGQASGFDDALGAAMVSRYNGHKQLREALEGLLTWSGMVPSAQSLSSLGAARIQARAALAASEPATEQGGNQISGACSGAFGLTCLDCNRERCCHSCHATQT